MTIDSDYCYSPAPHVRGSGEMSWLQRKLLHELVSAEIGRQSYAQDLCRRGGPLWRKWDASIERLCEIERSLASTLGGV